MLATRGCLPFLIRISTDPKTVQTLLRHSDSGILDWAPVNTILGLIQNLSLRAD